MFSELSRALARAYPHTYTKRKGKQRHTFVLGLESTTHQELPDEMGVEEGMVEDPGQSLRDENKHLLDEKRVLEYLVQKLEQRVKILEKRQSVCFELPTLEQQMYMVTERGTCTANQWS